MKMLSKNFKSRTCIYIGGLMEYISQKVAICSLWSVCPCFDVCHCARFRAPVKTQAVYLFIQLFQRTLRPSQCSRWRHCRATGRYTSCAATTTTPCRGSPGTSRPRPPPSTSSPPRLQPRPSRTANWWRSLVTLEGIIWWENDYFYIYKYLQ